MRFTHPDRPGLVVRLAYCLNLHPAEDLEGVQRGIGEITLAVAQRMQARAGFGLGAWLAAAVAVPLGAGEGLDEHARFVADHELDPFTYNAFPYGGFHRPGLKSGVFRPTWAETERVVYTASVARVAARVWERAGRRSRHVSISTHPGMFGADLTGPGDRQRCADNLARTAGLFARLERETGCRLVLGIEAEPRASAGTTEELAELVALVRRRAPEILAAEQGLDRARARAAVRRHLGACLDACHAAVEFEHPQDAYLAATRAGTPLAKLQFSSALELAEPQTNAVARERLFALDEPVFLHQVTGRLSDRTLVRARDLPEVQAAFAAGDAQWRAAAPWRCHFHVPVDLDHLGTRAGGLSTTRAFADELLSLALSDPSRWGADELHLEIETYTWDLLPGEARGAGSLVDGLEREYRHVEARLAAAGWSRATTPEARPEKPSPRS
jgi:hypothetical protein